MLDIPSISGIVAAVGVIVGVVFAVLELRNITRTRQTDLVVRLYSTFGTENFQEAYEKITTMEVKDFNDALIKGYLPKLRTVYVFFEGIGVLLHKKLADACMLC